MPKPITLWRKTSAAMAPVRQFACMAAAATIAGLTLTPAHAADPFGIYLTKNGDAQVQLAPCGNSVCGTIVALKEPVDRRTGKPAVDAMNPDPALKSRPMIGVQIFSMAPNSEGGWSGGIYNAEDGKTYRGQVIVRGPTQVEIRGCLLVFCGGEVWNKVADLPAPAAPQPPARTQTRR